jgi:hypothetical protein
MTAAQHERPPADPGMDRRLLAGQQRRDDVVEMTVEHPVELPSPSLK